jgi:hypothetical protein
VPVVLASQGCKSEVVGGISGHSNEHHYVTNCAKIYSGSGSAFAALGYPNYPSANCLEVEYMRGTDGSTDYSLLNGLNDSPPPEFWVMLSCSSGCPYYNKYSNVVTPGECTELAVYP